MLCLVEPSDPTWLGLALDNAEELLLEQAHLERKAASAAVTLLFTYSHAVAIQQPLSELAREELGHFELALEMLRRRGLEFGRQRPSAYADRLKRIIRPVEPERGVDSFLVGALIEARSCERMQLLARGFRGRDDELAEFYHQLTVSEARHHALYVELAAAAFPGEDITTRLAEIARHEAAVLRMHAPQPRLHG